MNRVVHFGIQAEQPERAMRFCRKIFGWELPKWMEQPPYWGIIITEKDSKEPGINGGLLARPAKPPARGCGTNAYVCTVQVESFDKTAKKIVATGGVVACPSLRLPVSRGKGTFSTPKAIPSVCINPTKMQDKTVAG